MPFFPRHGVIHHKRLDFRDQTTVFPNVRYLRNRAETIGSKSLRTGGGHCRGSGTTPECRFLLRNGAPVHGQKSRPWSSGGALSAWSISRNKSKKKRHSLHDRKLCRILFDHLSSLSECGLRGSFFGAKGSPWVGHWRYERG